MESIKKTTRQGVIEDIALVDENISRVTLTSFCNGEHFFSFLIPTMFEKDHSGQTAALEIQTLVDTLTGENYRSYFLEVGTDEKKETYCIAGTVEGIQRMVQRAYDENPRECRYLSLVS